MSQITRMETADYAINSDSGFSTSSIECTNQRKFKKTHDLVASTSSDSGCSTSSNENSRKRKRSRWGPSDRKAINPKCYQTVQYLVEIYKNQLQFLHLFNQSVVQKVPAKPVRCYEPDVSESSKITKEMIRESYSRPQYEDMIRTKSYHSAEYVSKNPKCVRNR